MASREARNKQVQQARETVRSWPAGLQRSVSSGGSASRTGNPDRSPSSSTQSQQQRGPQ